MTDILDTALRKGTEGTGLSPSEGIELSRLPDERIHEMLAVTDRVRRHYKGTGISLCSIVNAKSGLCGEDCSFCAQSVRYSTGVAEYPMADPEAIVRSAEEAARAGASEFSIVTSGTRLEKEREVAGIMEALESMKGSIGLERCASLGILDDEALKRLKESGLESYHHNLETGRSFFPRVCTTHGYDEDVAVVRSAKRLGFKVCSGGVFGLGESWEDRVELAGTLKDLGVDSVPINFLHPRPGTPLENASNLTPIECLKVIALIRLMMPDRDVVVCGGRLVNLRELKPLIFAAGANGMMIGNCLTTPGRPPEDDLAMLSDLGLKPLGPRAARP
jgi:biotin synthase